ncbi:MAG: YetF domain-containing protein [Burkholderiaceae bacterium]
MFSLSVPWWELVIRSAVVFACLLLLLRLTGKRQVGQLAPNDLVLLLILSNAVQNSMNAGDNSLIGGLVSAVTLVALNYGVSWLARKYRKIERFVDGRPQILVRNGTLYGGVMAEAGITRAELNGALRQAGCGHLKAVHLAILETNGSISVLQKEERGTPVGPRA